MKRNKNAVVAAFNAALLEEFATVDIVPSGECSYIPGLPEFTIETRAGTYICRPEDLPGKDSLNFIGVFGRFSEPARAYKPVDCNPYSGKWNFNGYGHVATEDHAREIATSIVTRILTV